MKKHLFALLHATCILRLIAWINRNKVTVLCYHSVSRRTDRHPNDSQLISSMRALLQHLDYLQAHHHVISLADFVGARREKTKLPARAAVLTFDDGFRNFFSVVAPILLERGIPATSFIVTSPEFTPEASEFTDDWCLEDDESHMSWNEIRRLASGGIEFGSHTSTHAPLSEISTVEAQVELQDSLNAIRRNLGATDVPLSYPHGKTSEAVNLLAREVGYYCALTTRLGQNDANCDLFALRRTVISGDDDVPTFAARLSGLTWWWGLARDFVSASTTAPLPADNQRYNPSVARNSES